MNCTDFLSICFRIVCSAQKIVYGYTKVVSETNKCSIISFTLSGFVTTNAILVHVQIHCQLELRYMFFLSNLF